MQQRRKCISCGCVIIKPGHDDPYVCRICESMMVNVEDRYAYLDR